MLTDEGTRPETSIVVDDGVIVAVVPDGDPAAQLRPGDVPFDARGDVVAPGLVSWRPTASPSYAELAREPFAGVLAVIAPADPAAVAWRERIGETASLRAAALLAAPMDAPDAVESLARLQAMPRPGPESTRAERAAWLRARTVGMAVAAKAPARGLIDVGQRGDVVFLESDPRDDLSVYDRPRQALVGGRPMRRAEIETNRDFVAAAIRFLAQLPPPEAGRVAFAIESSGLLVGRLDVAPDGRAVTEVWAPPVRTGHQWRLHGTASDWRHAGLITIGDRTRLHIEAQRTEAGVRVRGWLEEGERVVSETLLEAVADEPYFDPISLATRRRDRLMGLAPSEADAFDVLEILPVDQSLRMGVRRLAWRRMSAGPADAIRPDERAFRLETPSGQELGWVVLDPSGHARWGALIADAGITEYHRGLPVPTAGSPASPQPPLESVP